MKLEDKDWGLLRQDDSDVFSFECHISIPRLTAA